MKINFRTVVVVFASFFLFTGINHGLAGFHNASDSEVTINNGHEIFPDGHEQKILDSISIAVNIVLLVFHCGIIYSGLGNELNILHMLPLIVGIVFIVTGNLLPRVQVKDTQNKPLQQAYYGMWHLVSRTFSYALFFGGLMMIFSVLLPQDLILAGFFVILALTLVSAFFFSYIRYSRSANSNQWN
jgi:hypothetical protein